MSQYGSEAQFTQAINEFEVRMTESRVSAFLKKGALLDDGLRCQNCRMRELCGGVVALIIEELSIDQIRANLDMFVAHGIEIDDVSLAMCPERLVGTVVGHIDNEAFWISKKDPLQFSEREIQDGESVMHAAQSLVKRITNGQRL